MLQKEGVCFLLPVVVIENHGIMGSFQDLAMWHMVTMSLEFLASSVKHQCDPSIWVFTAKTHVGQASQK